MGNEFNSKGINYEENIFCEKRNSCGKGKINIIEGTDDERVTKLSDSEGVNIALVSFPSPQRCASGKIV